MTCITLTEEQIEGLHYGEELKLTSSQLDHILSKLTNKKIYELLESKVKRNKLGNMDKIKKLMKDNNSFIGKKTCKVCGLEKKGTEFYKNRAKCKICFNKKLKPKKEDKKPKKIVKEEQEEKQPPKPISKPKKIKKKKKVKKESKEDKEMRIWSMIGEFEEQVKNKKKRHIPKMVSIINTKFTLKEDFYPNWITIIDELNLDDRQNETTYHRCKELIKIIKKRNFQINEYY
jgi:hypothetical protein